MKRILDTFIKILVLVHGSTRVYVGYGTKSRLFFSLRINVSPSLSLKSVRWYSRKNVADIQIGTLCFTKFYSLLFILIKIIIKFIIIIKRNVIREQIIFVKLLFFCVKLYIIKNYFLYWMVNRKVLYNKPRWSEIYQYKEEIFNR